MKLKSAHLQNFMSHRDTYIEFDPYITSICGPSESGKTNIFRALCMLLMNKDWPEWAVRQGERDALVRVKFDSGEAVERSVHNKAQRISLIERSGKSQVFEGKKNVGEHLALFTGIRPVVLDEQSGPENLNFVEVDSDSLLFVGSYASILRRSSAIVGGSALEDAKNRLSKGLRKDTADLSALHTELDVLDFEAENIKLFTNKISDDLQTLNDLVDRRKNEVNKLDQFLANEQKFIEERRIHAYLLMYNQLQMDECDSLLNSVQESQDQLAVLNRRLELILDTQQLTAEIGILTAEMWSLQLAAEKLEKELPKCKECGRPL